MKDKFDIDFDVRVVERNIRNSKISSKDYKKHLENLDDLTDEAEPLVIEDDSDEQQGEELQTEDAEDAGQDDDGAED